MNKSLIITIFGPDQPGLVKSISETLEKYQGSWSESRMTHLAGKFAGIVSVSLAVDKIEKLKKSLDELQTDTFRIFVEETPSSITKTPPECTLSLELMAQDRPGIIHDITQQLAKLNVNIEELKSNVKQASMSGGTLFCAKLKLSIPKNIKAETVQETLEDMSDQFMVDLIFSD
ncbi:MAG: ACT domain-containing protein [Cocleimonas sp.]